MAQGPAPAVDRIRRERRMYWLAHHTGSSDAGLSGHRACGEGRVRSSVGLCLTGALAALIGCGSSTPQARCQGVVCAAPDQCHQTGTCDPQTGLCSSPAKPDGATCDDANACTSGDACHAGVCASGAPVACLALDECHDIGVCEPASGACTNPSRPDGSACNDLDGCTLTDACQAGACVGSNPVTCGALDACHDAGTCDDLTGLCNNPAKVEGSPCDDGNACTTTDSCLAGTCAGTGLVSCAEPDPCHEPGTCGPTTGTCGYLPKADGTPCMVGSAAPGTCRTGVCTEGTQAFERTVETDRRVMAMVPPEGGTVVATASSGVVYSLEIPANALEAPMQVAATPVTSLSGLAVTGPLVAAVHLEPSGLTFFQPARVRVSGIAGLAGTTLRAFVISDDGGTIDQVTFEMDGSDLIVQVGHFSDVAVYGGDAVEYNWCTGTAPFEQWLAALPAYLTVAKRAQWVVATLAAWLNDCNPNDDPSGFPRYWYVGNAYVSEMSLWHRDIVRRLDLGIAYTGYYSDPVLSEFNLWRSESLSRLWQTLLQVAQLDDTVFDSMAELGFRKIATLLEARFAHYEAVCASSGEESLDMGTWDVIYTACKYESSADPLSNRIFFGEPEKLMDLKTCGTVGLQMNPKEFTLVPGSTTWFYTERIKRDGTVVSSTRPSMQTPLPVLWDALGPPYSARPVTVDQRGVVTAVSAGEATVRATHYGPGGAELLRASAPVLVRELTIDVQPAVLLLREGETAVLHATFKDTTTQPSCEFQWLSSNVLVAAATAQPAGAPDAEVVGDYAGHANITVICGDEVGIAKLSVYNSIRVSPSAACMAVGASTQLTALALDMPISATVSWDASPEIVSIVNGWTTGLAGGQTIVTATLDDGADPLHAVSRIMVTPLPVCGTWDLLITDIEEHPTDLVNYSSSTVIIQPDWATPGQFWASKANLGEQFPIFVSGDAVTWSVVYQDQEGGWTCEDFFGTLTTTGELSGESEWTWHETGDCASERIGDGHSVYSGFLR